MLKESNKDAKLLVCVATQPCLLDLNEYKYINE